MLDHYNYKTMNCLHCWEEIERTWQKKYCLACSIELNGIRSCLAWAKRRMNDEKISYRTRTLNDFLKIYKKD